MNYAALGIKRVAVVLRALELAAKMSRSPKDKGAFNATAKELKRESNEETQTVFGGYWYLSDIDGLFDDDDGNEEKLTAKQKRKVLAHAFRSFDAGVGVNWDTLRYAYESLKEEGII